MPSTTTIREQLPGPPGPIRIPLHAPGSEDASPTAALLPGAFFVTSCGCHAGLAPACNPSTCALGSPGSWSPLRVRVGGSSKAFDMLMHAGPSLIRACRDKPTGCTLRATDRRNFPLGRPAGSEPPCGTETVESRRGWQASLAEQGSGLSAGLGFRVWG